MIKQIATVLVLLGCMMGSAFAAEGKFKLSSPGFKNNDTLPMEQVLNGFGCEGGNKSPRLEWKNPPAGTQSFALTVYDPDAPTGSGWWHWVVFDIPADQRFLELDAGNLAAGTLPAGIIQSVTDFGTPGFGGACPPAGDKPHRYIFTLYALSVPSLGLDAKSMPAMVGFNLRDKTLAKATLKAKFGR